MIVVVHSFVYTMSYIDKLALILVRNRRQLVAQSRGMQVYFTPGGKLEMRGSNIQVLIRECKQKLTVDLVPNYIQP